MPPSVPRRRSRRLVRDAGKFPHPNAPSVDQGPQSGIVTIPSKNSNDVALLRIEDLMETILDAIMEGNELFIPYRSVRSAQAEGDSQKTSFVRFPGRNIQEVKKFEALFRILELSHEALLSGNIITKRNIYYQNIELFKSQSTVDDMIDNLAFTLGVGRGDLNIAATAKGLIAGLVDLIMKGGSIIKCDHSHDGGTLLPSIDSIDKVDFRDAKWLLVIEKEATFRTLAESQYANNSKAGHGIIVTAKGFPDLATRRFLSILHSVRPTLTVFALVDFDPHGIAILRTYKTGSQRFEHEENVTVPDLKWLGIRSRDILSCGSGISSQDSQSSDFQHLGSQRSQDISSQESLTFSYDGSQEERHNKRRRVRKTRDPSETVASLTQADRKKAVSIMKEICAAEGLGGGVAAEMEQKSELQRMMMLNIKAEIQAVDNYGDITDWLNERLCNQQQWNISF
ncbi:Spo11/DNA topoisomerase VI subunit A [Podospora didyma]|uniref:DNA topoisomerase (ATP-hydrolyzing) n=1 Tax=Podospora didyma TaxID=330526 RepID=A0AAE0KJV5_9PEZI|nr:Spo11/DNA topoisomerase VI subunit A [Podospora didyma]